MDADALAKAFVEHYYTTFDNNDAGLVNLYQQDSSMLTFEGQKIQGAKNIAAKLTSLPFNQCVYSITTLTGQQHALKFSQMFHLLPTPQGSCYVSNDIFQLNYG
ncbi:hypothetical protein AAHE18_04G047500 [Arachis hypogaea]